MNAVFTVAPMTSNFPQQFQAFLQVFEREITDIFQGFANRLNHRLNRTPGVRVLKRLMDRIRGKRKVIF